MSKPRLINFNISGNIIDPSWFKYICFSNGKPQLNAIMILSEIVYWYRPKIERDEKTGQIKSIKQRFKSDFLQRSRKSFEEQFGLTTKQVKDSLKLLEDIGIIKRHLRTIESEDLTLGNVLFIELNIEKLKEISTHVDDDRPLGYKNTKGSTSASYGLSIEVPTNTENTTKNTIPPIISPEGGESDGAFKVEEGIIETPSNENSPQESFETFWEIYPRKIGKENAYKQFESNLRKRHNFEEMLNSAKLYSAYCKQRQLEPSYIKTPAAFLKNIWNDEGSLKEWELSLTKTEDAKIPFSRMPADAVQRLRKLIATKQLLDEHGNPITERTGFVEEFLNSGHWNSLPGFVQKAIVEFQPAVETKSNAVPEPTGWREHLKQNYDPENETLQRYLLKGWKSIPEWLQRDIVFEMEQK